MNKKIIGTWELVSLQSKTKDKKTYYPLGKDTLGYLIYTEDFFMSVSIMKLGRPPFKSHDLISGTSEEKLSAIESYFTYCGTFSIQEDKVIHNIKLSLFPNWIETSQTRNFTFEDNNLILSTPYFKIDGSEQSFIITWKKIK